jgi:leucine dehydrogenase
MQAYASPQDALGDALRLSRGMTYKYAAAGLPHGGAKSTAAVGRAGASG